MWDDPIQIANNNSKIIHMAQLRFHTSKLSSIYKTSILSFINQDLRWSISSRTTLSYCFMSESQVCNFIRAAI